MTAAAGSGRSVFRAQRALVAGRLQPARVWVEHGVVTAVERGPEPVNEIYSPEVEVVDVPDGGLLLPGNVDTHVHVNEPGRTQWEGFGSATEAAARGGITTLVDMPLNSIPPTTTVEALELKRAAARPQLCVDVGYWGGAVPDNLGTFETLWRAGVFGFKCFTIDSGVPEFPPLDDEQLDRAMAEIAAFDGLLIVHAEDPGVIAGQPAWSSRRYADFVRSRPDRAEVVAIRRVVDLARRHGTRVHILHLSSAQALDVVKDAKDAGVRVTVETCPHYLIFDSESVPDGAAEFKCCPPIRGRENQRLLWSALRDGVIDCVVSDHSPSTLEEKVKGDGDLALAWGGVSSLQVTFPTMVDKAAGRGIGIADVSRWMSSGPAAVAGLTGKGAIAVGHDADLVVYRPGRAITVDGERLAHRNKLTAYTGRTISGSVSQTVVRGRTVFDGEQVYAGTGRELLRTTGPTGG